MIYNDDHSDCDQDEEERAHAGAIGVSGEVLRLQAGYSHEVILHATAQGVTRTLDTWGGIMRRAINTSKVAEYYCKKSN
jgi:hypothetical protein